MVHGVPLVWNEKSSELSMSHLTKELRSLVLEQNKEINPNLFPEKYSEDILSRLGTYIIIV